MLTVLLDKLTDRLIALQLSFLLIMKLGLKAPSNIALKKVIFDLNDRRLEPYYFCLLYFFNLIGYQIVLKRNFGFLGSFRRYYKYLMGFENIGFEKKAVRHSIRIYDGNFLNNRTYYKKNIRINLNAFDKKARRKHDLSLPFPMHPNIYFSESFSKLNHLRDTSRKIKMFFSGNTHRTSYDNEIINNLFRLTNRWKVIEALCSGLSGEEILMLEDSAQLSEHVQKYVNRIVLCRWEWSPLHSVNLKARIENGQWLETLAISDFFVATPGIRMPMCHNVIEAMAVGTIPLLEYSSYFDPGLVDGVNCITFNGADDLLVQTKRILSMSQSEIALMRQNVIQYYEAHLSPEGFCNKIEDNPAEEFDLFLQATNISHTYLQENAHNNK